jgi:steroid 5-alpha reductase family enzyme
MNYLNLLEVSGASVLALTVVHSITFAIGRRIGRYNVVDVAWGVGFVVIAAVAATLGHGDPARRWLLLALVTIWGLRLSWHIQRKTAGKGEDPRYAKLLGDATVGQVVRKVFLLQAVITWFVSFPLQLSAVTGPTPQPLTAFVVAGAAVWLIGVTFEAVGDRQLRVFKSDPENRGVVMDRGLWAWTRHPNYFGHRGFATADDLLPRLCDRRPAHREIDGRPSRLRRVQITDRILLPPATEISTSVTTASMAVRANARLPIDDRTSSAEQRPRRFAAPSRPRRRGCLRRGVRPHQGPGARTGGTGAS